MPIHNSKEGPSNKPYEAVPLENIDSGALRFTDIGIVAAPQASAETLDDLGPGTSRALAVETGVEADPSSRRFNMPDTNRQCLGCIGIVVGLIVLLSIVLIALSFSGVEYSEMAFRKRRTTGSVDLSHVYNSGLHFIGPDYEFKPFPAGAHFEDLRSTSVFNADRLELKLTARLQYFVRPHQLHLLHKKFDVHYRPVIRKNAVDAIKGAATVFTNREMILQRTKMEAALFKAVKERLGGKCCEKDCWTAENDNCVPGCKPYDSCTAEDYGLFSDVRYFQLLDVSVPAGLNERYLEALVLQEQNQREILNQRAVITRKGTDQLVKQTDNIAEEIFQTAQANASLIISMANAESKAIVEKARSDGLKNLFSTLRITTDEQKIAFDYLRTLRKQGKVKLAVDYQTYVAGPMSDEL